MNHQTDRLNSALDGRYRIIRHLGEGGMATVYLCEDLKHERQVALKLLKPELAAVLGAERFVQEIKTTAALQHPHILPLFDSGAADGFLFYVMPFIDGETLRAKLDRETQLGVDDAVRIARDVADALHYAHTRGIVHRDVKPENILLHDGRPMIADFGIALAVSAAAGGRMTETGLSLGTPHYMSPEQATAEKEITPRSDVYSLGSVLYEMLTGNAPFTGANAQQIIMKIITTPAELVTVYRKAVPSNVAAAVAMSLEKLPADRFDSAKTFAEALGNSAFATSAAHASNDRMQHSAGWRERVAIPALGLSVVLASLTLWAVKRPTSPLVVSRYEVALPDGKRVGSTQWSPMAVSPDGSRLVYVGENGRLFVRSRDQLEPVELNGTEGAFNPFFSPDGTQVGFMSGASGSSDIKVISLAGGPPTVVTSTGVGGPGAAWGYDGYIYFDASGVGPLRRVRVTGGGAPEDVSVRDSAGGEQQHNWPDPLPNGRGVLMVVDRGGPGINANVSNEIAVLDLKTRRHRVLMRGINARYAASGHILYVTSAGVLMAVPFDQDRMELAGAPVAVGDGISIRRGGGGVDLTIAKNGTLWYGSGGTLNPFEIVWSSRTGDVTPLDTAWTAIFGALEVSPDGTRLAVAIEDNGVQQIWVKPLGVPNSPLTKLTFNGSNSLPHWHPDGKQVLFVTSSSTKATVHVVNADGTSPVPRNLLQARGRTYAARWSADGNWIVYEGTADGTNDRNIYAVRVGDTTVIPIAITPSGERDPSLSPDGRWVMYSASTTGINEVYVRPFPNASAGSYQISNDGGTRPMWSRDGREIFYANTNGDLMRVAVVPGNAFSTTDRRKLFSVRGIDRWDVMPDGTRFIMTREREGLQRRKLVVVENFFEELKARVPANK